MCFLLMLLFSSIATCAASGGAHGEKKSADAGARLQNNVMLFEGTSTAASRCTLGTQKWQSHNKTIQTGYCTATPFIASDSASELFGELKCRDADTVSFKLYSAEVSNKSKCDAASYFKIYYLQVGTCRMVAAPKGAKPERGQPKFDPQFPFGAWLLAQKLAATNMAAAPANSTIARLNASTVSKISSSIGCVDNLASNVGRQGVCVYNCTRLRVHFGLQDNTTCKFVGENAACKDTFSPPQAQASRSEPYEVPAWASVIIQGNVGGSTQQVASANLPYCGRVIVGVHAIAVVRAIRITGQSNVAITVGRMASVLIDDCMIDHNVGPVCSTDCTPSPLCPPPAAPCHGTQGGG